MIRNLTKLKANFSKSNRNFKASSVTSKAFLTDNQKCKYSQKLPETKRTKGKKWERKAFLKEQAAEKILLPKQLHLPYLKTDYQGQIEILMP